MACSCFHLFSLYKQGKQAAKIMSDTRQKWCQVVAHLLALGAIITSPVSTRSMPLAETEAIGLVGLCVD